MIKKMICSIAAMVVMTMPTFAEETPAEEPFPFVPQIIRDADGNVAKVKITDNHSAYCKNKHNIAKVVYNDRKKVTLEQSLKDWEDYWNELSASHNTEWFVNVEFQRVIRTAYRTTLGEEDFLREVVVECIFDGY